MIRTYLKVYVALMALLILTVLAGYAGLGRLSGIVNLSIAIAKAVLIVLFFMHVKLEKPLLRVFVGAGFYWLLILLALALSDYLSRGWLDVPGK